MGRPLTSLGNTGHVRTRCVFVSYLLPGQFFPFFRRRLARRRNDIRTGPGPGYKVSSHVRSLTWISWGLIRTIGPRKKSHQNPRSKTSHALTEPLTVSLMHAVNLLREQPPTTFNAVVIEFIPFRRRGDFGTRELGEGMQGEAVDDESGGVEQAQEREIERVDHDDVGFLR